MAQTMAKNMEMARLIYILLVTLITIGCKAQKDILLYNTIPFDFKRYHKEKDHLNEYSYYTKDSTSVSIDGFTNRYRKDVIPLNSMFIYIYNLDGSLKATVKRYPNDFKAHHIIYDTKGNIIEEVDHDQNYPFTFTKVQEFIKNKGLKLKDMEVVRGTSSGTPRWNVSWHKKENYHKGITIILDGVTGEVLEEQEYDYYY